MSEGRQLLRPSGAEAEAAWQDLVAANNAQVKRTRERIDADDFYAPVASFFRADPHRSDDPTLNALQALAEPGESWLDVGAGGGRFALGVAPHVGRLIAVEPSEGMRAVFEEVRAESGIENVELIAERWPMAGAPEVDVVMFTHVGYDIAAIGPFLDGVEASARRLCVAVLLERSPGSAFAELWEGVHGEPPALLPGLPEFVSLLMARGRMPNVTIVGTRPFQFASMEEVEEAARRRMWVNEETPKHERIKELLPSIVREGADGSLSAGPPLAIGVVTWQPTSDAS